MDYPISELRHGFVLKGTNNKAVLLIHGFGGSPCEQYLTALALNKVGYTVVAPCLAHHATSLEDFDHSKWESWLGSAIKAYEDIKEEYKDIYVVGLSMGGLIALCLGAKYPSIKALGLMAPALVYKSKVNYLSPFIAPFVKHLPYAGENHFPLEAEKLLEGGYNVSSVPACTQLTHLQRYTKKQLKDIKQPFFLFFSKADSLVDYKRSERLILSKTSSTDKEVQHFEKTSHVMSLDADRDTIFQDLITFFGKN
jgi:carboxylesterase